MATETEIRKELDGLVNEVPDLLKLCEGPKQILAFGAKYQDWYSRAIKLVELLGSDRLSEFCGYYLIDPKRKSYSAGTYVIQDYVKGIGASTDYMDMPNWDIHNAVAVRVTNQSHILASLKARLGSVLADVRGHVAAED